MSKSNLDLQRHHICLARLLCKCSIIFITTSLVNYSSCTFCLFHSNLLWLSVLCLYLKESFAQPPRTSACLRPATTALLAWTRWTTTPASVPQRAFDTWGKTATSSTTPARLRRAKTAPASLERHNTPACARTDSRATTAQRKWTNAPAIPAAHPAPCAWTDPMGISAGVLRDTEDASARRVWPIAWTDPAATTEPAGCNRTVSSAAARRDLRARPARRTWTSARRSRARTEPFAWMESQSSTASACLASRDSTVRSTSTSARLGRARTTPPASTRRITTSASACWDLQVPRVDTFARAQTCVYFVVPITVHMGKPKTKVILKIQIVIFGLIQKMNIHIKTIIKETNIKTTHYTCVLNQRGYIWKSKMFPCFEVTFLCISQSSKLEHRHCKVPSS